MSSSRCCSFPIANEPKERQKSKKSTKYRDNDEKSLLLVPGNRRRRTSHRTNPRTTSNKKGSSRARGHLERCDRHCSLYSLTRTTRRWWWNGSREISFQFHFIYVSISFKVAVDLRMLISRIIKQNNTDGEGVKQKVFLSLPFKAKSPFALHKSSSSSSPSSPTDISRTTTSTGILAISRTASFIEDRQPGQGLGITFKHIVIFASRRE